MVEELREAELEMEVSICELEKGEVLGEDEDLKTETSSETKGSHDFKFDNLFMFVDETCEEGQFVDIVVKEEEDRYNLNYVLKEEVEKDIKQSSEGLDEIEEKTIEIFLSHVEDLEQQQDLVIESTNEIMRSCGFTTDKLCVNAGFAEDKPFYGTILNEVEIFQVKYNDDYLSNEDQVELLQHVMTSKNLPFLF